MPFSNIKMAIAEILVREGYLEKTEKSIDGRQLVLTLKYINKAPAVHEINRLSKPGNRCYVGKGEIKQVLNGLGLSIISTPRGLMTNREARAAALGGELICEVY
jgi:small subunit ribosomal protein S8